MKGMTRIHVLDATLLIGLEDINVTMPNLPMRKNNNNNKNGNDSAKEVGDISSDIEIDSNI